MSTFLKIAKVILNVIIMTVVIALSCMLALIITTYPFSELHTFEFLGLESHELMWLTVLLAVFAGMLYRLDEALSSIISDN